MLRSLLLIEWESSPISSSARLRWDWMLVRSGSPSMSSSWYCDVVACCVAQLMTSSSPCRSFKTYKLHKHDGPYIDAIIMSTWKDTSGVSQGRKRTMLIEGRNVGTWLMQRVAARTIRSIFSWSESLLPRIGSSSWETFPLFNIGFALRTIKYSTNYSQNKQNIAKWSNFLFKRMSTILDF